MGKIRYEIVEKDTEARDRILSSLVDRPTQGVAFLSLMTGGRPMSAADIVDFLSISDSWYAGQFDAAVKELAGSGIIREARPLARSRR